MQAATKWQENGKEMCVEEKWTVVLLELWQQHHNIFNNVDVLLRDTLAQGSLNMLHASFANS